MSDKPLSIVELLQQVGSENISVQFPLTDGAFVAATKTKHYTALTFAAYAGLAEELAIKGKPSKALLALWIDAELLERARQEHREGVPAQVEGSRWPIGHYVRIEHSDGRGGAGLLSSITEANEGGVLLNLDYGYSFKVTPEVTVAVLQETPVDEATQREPQHECKRQAAYDSGAVRGSVALVDCACLLCQKPFGGV